jgi:hypothetical protein
MYMGTARTNWDEIRHRYVAGIDVDGVHEWPTLEQLSNTFAVNFSTMRQRAAADGWLEKRNSFKAQAEQARLASSMQTLAASAAMLDVAVSEAATALVAQVRQHIDLAIGRGEPLAASAIASLSRALQSAQVAGRLATGRATEISEQHVEDQSPSAINKVVRAERAMLSGLTYDELMQIRNAQQLIENAKQAREAARNHSAQSAH